MNDAHPDTDWGDCEEECEVGSCTCDDVFPPLWLIGLVVVGVVIAGVLL